MLFTPLLLSLIPLSPAAQVVNPATAQNPPAPATTPPPTGQHSWDMPSTLVTAESWSPYKDSELIGEYGQPRWTSRRLFPTTRVYVLRPGQFDAELWHRIMVPDKGSTVVETQYEVEVGLPGRFQFDYYLVTDHEGSEGQTDFSETKYEVRYALADWGKLPWNPTLYAEWKTVSGGPDGYEAKLLLGDEVSPGWKVGVNLVYEREISGDLSNEYQITAGVSHTVVDEKLSLGGEMRAGLTDIHSDRGNYEKELEIGPSLQWRPVPAMHLDFAPLIGIGSDSRAADIVLVLGWEF